MIALVLATILTLGVYQDDTNETNDESFNKWYYATHKVNGQLKMEPVSNFFGKNGTFHRPGEPSVTQTFERGNDER